MTLDEICAMTLDQVCDGTPPGATISVSPAIVPAGHSAPITLTLTGLNGTTWTSGTVFSISGATKVSQGTVNVAAQTCTLVITTANVAAATITESSDSATGTLIVAIPWLYLSPSAGPSGTSIGVAGLNTLWETDLAATNYTMNGSNPLFSVSAGAVITESGFTTNTSTTLAITFSGGGPYTITDNSTGATATFSVYGGVTNIVYNLPLVDIVQQTTPQIVIGPFWSNSAPYGPLTSGTPTLTIRLPQSNGPIAASGATGTLGADGKTTYTFAGSETAMPGQISLAGVVGSTSFEWSENYQVGVASGSVAPIVVAPPLSWTGQLYVNCGDDYPAGVAWQFGVPSTFTSLTGSTPTLDVTHVIGGVPSATPVLTITGSILTGSYTINGTTYSTILQFTPTAAQTALLTAWSPNAYQYRVRAIWTSPSKTITVVTPSPCTALW